VPLIYRPAQHKVWAEIKRQRARGGPVRVNVGKSRKTGVSTAIQGIGLQDLTLNANREGLVVAHDRKTAGKLFNIAMTMYSNLPDDPVLRPPIAHLQDSMDRKSVRWGDRIGFIRGLRDRGLNSMLEIDTAQEVGGGRGATPNFLHCSEIAHWPNAEKALALLNSVPDVPGTTIICESTANSFNFWKDHWDRADRHEGRFRNVFISWLEDPQCQEEFESPEHRASFVAEIGRKGPKDVIKDEGWLMEKLGATPEQLYWRRLTISDKANGDVDWFKQEYPAVPEEMFVGSGKHVFPPRLQRSAIESAEHFDPQGVEGTLTASGFTQRWQPNGHTEVPTGALWVPSRALGDQAELWKLWLPTEHDEPPTPAVDRQFVMAVDPAGTNATTIGADPDSWAIQVIDHSTLEQVAAWQGRLDTDLIAEQVFLAYLFFNEALTAVEVTGGWGVPLVDDQLSKRYGHRRLFRRQKLLYAKDQSAGESAQTALGWSTNRQTKPQLIEGMRELLREETHGIKHLHTALQLRTFVWNESTSGSKTAGASESAHDDLLMAYMIAQQVARLVRPRPKQKPRVSSSVPRNLRH
jgi:hypothetical protein